MTLNEIEGKTIERVEDEWMGDNNGSVIKLWFTDGSIIRIGAVDAHNMYDANIWYQDVE